MLEFFSYVLGVLILIMFDRHMRELDLVQKTHTSIIIIISLKFPCIYSCIFSNIVAAAQFGDLISFDMMVPLINLSVTLTLFLLLRLFKSMFHTNIVRKRIVFSTLILCLIAISYRIIMYFAFGLIDGFLLIEIVSFLSMILMILYLNYIVQCLIVTK